MGIGEFNAGRGGGIKPSRRKSSRNTVFHQISPWTPIYGYVQTVADSISCRHRKLLGIVWTPIRYVVLHLRERRGADSLCYRNRAEITVFICEQKPYPVWFSCRPERLSGIVWTAIQYVTPYFADRRGAASLRDMQKSRRNNRFWL